MSLDSTSFANLLSSIAGTIPGIGQNVLTQINQGINTSDSVQLTGLPQDEEEAAAAEKAQRGHFDEAFTKDIVATLFGKDPSELTEQQTSDLSDLLFTINQENARRKEAGEEPLTKDEINEYIKTSIADYEEEAKALKESGEDGEIENTLGKTLSELGITELSDEQMAAIDKALSQYENGEKISAVEDAKAAEEAAKAAEEAAAQQAKQDSGAQEAGGTGGTGGTGGASGARGTGGSRGAGSTGGAGATGNSASAKEAEGASNTPELAEDLPGLQQQKSDAQGTIGDLKSQIDSKKSEINQRKAEIAKEASTEGMSEKDKTLQNAQMKKYEEAQKEYDKVREEKATIQQEQNQTNKDIAQNQQDLYTKAADKQAKSAEVSSAQNELNSLTPPAAPSGDDEAAKAAYETAKAEYEKQKAALQEKVDNLKAEEEKIQADIDKLESNKEKLEKTKALQEKKMTACDAKMQKKQEEMDKIMTEMQEKNPALQEAMKNDEQLQAMEAEISSLESQIAEQENFISQIDQEIAVREKEDSAVQEVRQQEAKDEFAKALEEAGNPTISNWKETEHGIDLDDPKEANDAIEWARKTLQEDPGNEQAMAVLEKGTDFLEQKAAAADNAAVEAVLNMPDGLKDDANAYIAEAIQKAEEAGEDTDMAARKATAEYMQQLLKKDDLSDEDRALVQKAADATAANLEAEEAYDNALAAKNDAEFYKAVADLPEGCRKEVEALHDSIEALKQPGADKSYDEAYNNIIDYIVENPDDELDMETAKSMFGDFGPVALAAVRDNDGNVSKALNGEDFENIDTDELYRNASVDLANYNINTYDDKMAANQQKYEEAGFFGKVGAKVGEAVLAKENEAWTKFAEQAASSNVAEKADTNIEARMLAASMSEAAIAAASVPSLEQLMSNPSEFGLALAEQSAAYANSDGGTGYCYRGVATALARMGINIGGPSAFCAVDELDSKYPDQFYKYTSADISKDQLKDLPVGTIVIYGKNNGWGGGYHGHIYVTQANGKETSDHWANINPSGFGDEYYVYFPK